MNDSDHVSALRRRAAAARRISEEVLNPLDKQGLRQLADELEAQANLKETEISVADTDLEQSATGDQSGFHLKSVRP